MDYLNSLKTITAAVSAYMSGCASCSHDKEINQGSPLLNLPRELRDQIFSYLLVEPSNVTLVYTSKSKSGYARALKASRSYGQRRMGRRFGRSPGMEMFGLSDCHHNLIKLAQLCRQVNYEAQETFFRRNRFIFYSAFGIPSVSKMHAVWLSMVSLWCRPSVGESRIIWMHVAVERMKGRQTWKITWEIFRYENEPEDKALNQKLLAWTQVCDKMMLKRLKAHEELVDVNAIVDVLSGPPMCKQMDVSVSAESRHRR
ncbi:hypothetical protein PRZ48_011906 [Zasmidium cellare]|uniref:F-box domain-containing protein n=1 Tax=Zasmidium cellare TaxID=395010 RepID=A0ABR0E887_ZASCE|nr:hypothetical protein PRZ48_011906 [Zasmidium cellare]